MSRKILTLCLGMGIILLTAQHGFSQSAKCADREIIVSQLAEKYGETRQSIGLGDNNSVIEVFASDETGTWTITITLTSGLTCLIASGEAFEHLAESLPDESSSDA